MEFVAKKQVAYLKHHGFMDVNQLHGEIWEYARSINQLHLESNFIGKNFVFYERKGESVKGEVISDCHQCHKSCVIHINCAMNCACSVYSMPRMCRKYEKCCSAECCNIKNATETEKEQFRLLNNRKLVIAEYTGKVTG